MSQPRTVLFDNEAVQVLTDPGHPKHRRVIAVMEAVAARNLRAAGTVRLVVPTAVRVEAGWDRRAARSASINRLRVSDADLDAKTADIAAAIRVDLAVSAVDAHLGAVINSSEQPVAVLTSDPGDVKRMAEHRHVDVRVLRV